MFTAQNASLCASYSTIASRCGIFFTMPRKAGVSGRSTIRLIFFNPSARTMTLCFSGVQIGLRTSLIFIIPGMCLSHLLQCQAAQIGHLFAIPQPFECVDSGFHHVVRIARPDGLGQHVRNSHRLNDGAHRTAGNDTSSRRGWLQQHASAAEPAEYRMLDGSGQHMHAAQIFLGSLDALFDGPWDFLGFAGAETPDLAPPLPTYPQTP